MIEAVNIGPLLVPTWPASVILALLVAVLATGRLVAGARLDRSWLQGVAEGTAWIGVLGALSAGVVRQIGILDDTPAGVVAVAALLLSIAVDRYSQRSPGAT